MKTIKPYTLLHDVMPGQILVMNNKCLIKKYQTRFHQKGWITVGTAIRPMRAGTIVKIEFIQDTEDVSSHINLEKDND